MMQYTHQLLPFINYSTHRLQIHQQLSTPNMNPTQKLPSNKKQKKQAHRRTRRKYQKLSSQYNKITSIQGSAIKQLLQNQNYNNDFDMTNQITIGHTRKIKKKIKKLEKRYHRPHSQDQMFQQINKFKQNIIDKQMRTIFNPTSQMEKRRQKRMKKMEQNTINMKKQVKHTKNNRQLIKNKN